MPEEVIWRPSEDFLENSNVARFMKKQGHHLAARVRIFSS